MDMKNSKLTEEDRAWLCSCSSYAKVKKPELTVMATSDVEIMLHNLRFEIDEIKTAWIELVGNTPETDAFGNVFISEIDYDTFTKIINPPTQE